MHSISAGAILHACQRCVAAARGGEEHLMEANSVNALASSATRLVGPALGGLLGASLGLAGVVVIGATSFLFSAVAIG